MDEDDLGEVITPDEDTHLTFWYHDSRIEESEYVSMPSAPES